MKALLARATLSAGLAGALMLSACASPSAPVSHTVFDTGKKVTLSTVAYRIEIRRSPQIDLTQEQRGKIIAAVERGFSTALAQAGITAVKHNESTPYDTPEARIEIRLWEMTVIPMITFPIPQKRVDLSMEAFLWVNGVVFKTKASSTEGGCRQCSAEDFFGSLAEQFGGEIASRVQR